MHQVIIMILMIQVIKVEMNEVNHGVQFGVILIIECQI